MLAVDNVFSAISSKHCYHYIHTTATNNKHTLANFFIEGGIHRACGNSSGAQDCPTNYNCLQGNNTNPNYGFTSFDTVAKSLFVVFRAVQRDFWEETMQYLTATAGAWHILLFIALIYIVSFQLCALIWSPIAVVYNYLKDEQWENDLLNDLNKVCIRVVSVVADTRHNSLFYFTCATHIITNSYVLN